MNKIILIAVALSVLSCSRSATYEAEPDSLNPDRNDDRRPSYTFDQELENDSCRFVSEELALDYAAGGIIFSREAVESTTVYRATELSTGRWVELDMPAGRNGIPRLTIDGRETDITGAEVKARNEKGVWIHIQTPDHKNMVFVVTDL